MGANWCLLVLLVFIGTHHSEQRSTPNSQTYRAGVVEYHPLRVDNDGERTLDGNAAAYVEFIQQAGSKDLDIIVFPEDGLTTTGVPPRRELDPWTTLIPAPTDNYIPCDNSTIPVSKTLQTISCAAKSNGVYVVINIAEKYPCDGNECANGKVLYYNSNVVFDRDGKVIARYRKTNLFLEPQFNVTTTPELVTFDTDFGVTFGTFICFDILFHEPAMSLTRTLGVRDIVFPTAWFSETPFLTAIQTQAGWAYAEDVNLLASGYNNPERQNSGSGIYFGRQGIGKAILPFNDRSELVIADVPKKMKKQPREENHSHDHHIDLRNGWKTSGVEETPSVLKEKLNETGFYNQGSGHEHEHIHDELRRKRYEELEVPRTKRSSTILKLLYEDLSMFETQLIVGNELTVKTLCHNNFCCEFTVNVSSWDTNTSYRLVVFHGVRTYIKIINAGTSACAVLQCANDSITSCGHPKSSGTTFNLIDITATFEQNSGDLLVMPSSLSSTLFPLLDWTYEEHNHHHEGHDHSHIHINYKLEKATRDLVTFGIYARDFGNDGKNQSDFSSSGVTFRIGLCIIIPVLQLLF